MAQSERQAGERSRCGTAWAKKREEIERVTEANSGARTAIPRQRPLKTLRPAIGIGVVGLGTVGTGTIKVLLEHEYEVSRRLGCQIELRSICARTIHKRDLSWIKPPVTVTMDWREVVKDPEIDIVVELVGNLETARAITEAALDNRKHLVTANKQLVADYGKDLVERSARAGVHLGIEACVAGGTPILHAVRDGLAGENFTAVYGILNGTTNYILTEMERRGAGFAEVLREAQELGYAEPDPTFDVEGYDARFKIAILAMLCFGQMVKAADIPAEGITRIDGVDFAYAQRLQHTIRLIAGARRRPGGELEIFVRPMMIPASAQLARITGPINGILLVGNKGGNTLVSGRGAGGEPTGVAVLSDIVQIARDIVAGSTSSTPLGYQTWHAAKLQPDGASTMSAYLRLVVKDRPGILARVCGILARHHINIDSVLQEPAHSKNCLPFVMTLEPTREKNVRAALVEIRRLPFLADAPLMMPFADLP
jgi:homoserine dehydrogenase